MGLQVGSVGQAAKDGLYFKSRGSLSSALPAITLGQRQIKGHSRQATGQGHGLQGAQKDPWKSKKMEGGKSHLSELPSWGLLSVVGKKT